MALLDTILQNEKERQAQREANLVSVPSMIESYLKGSELRRTRNMEMTKMKIDAAKSGYSVDNNGNLIPDSSPIGQFNNILRVGKVAKAAKSIYDTTGVDLMSQLSGTQGSARAGTSQPATSAPGVPGVGSEDNFVTKMDRWGRPAEFTSRAALAEKEKIKAQGKTQAKEQQIEEFGSNSSEAGPIAFGVGGVKGVQTARQLLFPGGTPDSFNRAAAVASNPPRFKMFGAEIGPRKAPFSYEGQTIYRELGKALAARTYLISGKQVNDKERQDMAAQFLADVGSDPRALYEGLASLESDINNFLVVADPKGVKRKGITGQNDNSAVSQFAPPQGPAGGSPVSQFVPPKGQSAVGSFVNDTTNNAVNAFVSEGMKNLAGPTGGVAGKSDGAAERMALSYSKGAIEGTPFLKPEMFLDANQMKMLEDQSLAEKAAGVAGFAVTSGPLFFNPVARLPKAIPVLEKAIKASPKLGNALVRGTEWMLHQATKGRTPQETFGESVAAGALGAFEPAAFAPKSPTSVIRQSFEQIEKKLESPESRNIFYEWVSAFRGTSKTTNAVLKSRGAKEVLQPANTTGRVFDVIGKKVEDAVRETYQVTGKAIDAEEVKMVRGMKGSQIDIAKAVSSVEKEAQRLGFMDRKGEFIKGMVKGDAALSKLKNFMELIDNRNKLGYQPLKTVFDVRRQIDTQLKTIYAQLQAGQKITPSGTLLLKLRSELVDAVKMQANPTQKYIQASQAYHDIFQYLGESLTNGKNDSSRYASLFRDFWKPENGPVRDAFKGLEDILVQHGGSKNYFIDSPIGITNAVAAQEVVGVKTGLLPFSWASKLVANHLLNKAQLPNRIGAVIPETLGATAKIAKKTAKSLFVP